MNWTLFVTLLGCLSIGIVLRYAFLYLKDRKGFEWDDNVAEAIVGIIVSAVVALLVVLCTQYPVVLWIICIVGGIFNKWGMEKLNKLTGK